MGAPLGKLQFIRDTANQYDIELAVVAECADPINEHVVGRTVPIKGVCVTTEIRDTGAKRSMQHAEV